MKSRIVAATLVLLSALLLWYRPPSNRSDKRNPVAAGAVRAADMDENPAAVGSPPRTKHSQREIMMTIATHSPRQLKDFILPELVLDGLTLEQAVRKVFASYEDTCRLTGETPLPMKFEIPAENQRLRLRLESQDFRNSLHLLAALGGMKLTRHELTWRFTPLGGGGRVDRVLKVNPAFLSNLQAAIGSSNAPAALRQTLENAGLVFDADAELALAPNGRLTLKNVPAIGASRIAALAQAFAERQPLQQKFTSRIIELPKRFELPPTEHMTDIEVVALMRMLAQKRGTELMTMPSITAKNGQSAAIELTKEFIYPDDDADSGFGKKNVGKVMSVDGHMLGFGQDFNFHYSDTQVEMISGKPVFGLRSDLPIKGFTPDGTTTGRIQERADGTCVLVLVTSQRIDATGRPIDMNR